MYTQAQIQGDAISRVSGTKPVQSYATSKPSTESVAATGTAMAHSASAAHTGQDTQLTDREKRVIWIAAAVSVGVVLLFIVAKKWGYIKF